MKTTGKPGATADCVAPPGWSALRADGVQVLRAQALQQLDWLVHGFSMRPGGTSSLKGERVLNLGYTRWDSSHHVAANRLLLLGVLDAAGMQLVTLRQTHSDGIHMLTCAPEHALRGDAAATRTPALLLAVGTADCVPVLLADTRHHAVAAVHAGWRGTLKRIAAKAIGRMRMEFGTLPQDVLAALGPAIGRCCYEVGPEVARAYAGQFAQAREWFDGPFDALASGAEPTPLRWLSMAPPGHTPPPARVRLDLAAANRWQLVDAGVPPAQIFTTNFCTACRTDLFFSYRREGADTGRLLGVIGIRK